MNVGQQAQVTAKRLAARLMQGTIPQSDTEIEVSVSITLKDASGSHITLSASDVLVDKDEYADGRDLSFMVAE